MPYTDNKSQKFDQTLLLALTQVGAEANYLDELSDADLSEPDLRAEVKAGEADIWKGLDAMVGKYDFLEQTLIERRKELDGEGARDQSPEWRSAADRVIESIETDLDSLHGDIDSQLLSQIKERLRLTINQRVQPNYQPTLTMSEAPGLSEVLDPSRMVDTNAKSSLLFMLNTMAGGSIGIAGSRGAGKSTLIQMCCGKNRTINDIKGVRILPVLTSAPVQYESRDFILYLFSTLCQRVLDPHDTGENLRSTPEVEGYSSPTRKIPMIDWLVNRSPGILLNLGAILMAIGLLAALIVALASNQDSNRSEPQVVRVEFAGQSSPQPSPGALPAPVTQPSVGRTGTFITNLVRGLEIKPGIPITWAIIVWLLALGLTTLRKAYFEKPSFPQSYEQYVAATKEQRREWLAQADTSDRLTRSRLEEFYARRRLERDGDPLERHARYWLHETRFQQSFTSGWSGALKLPVGLEGGINRAVTLAQRQMSNPEIVAAYLRFVEEVSGNQKVIIGIDEMDKMESEDDARKFLNEIKAIFGVKNCFYLVSVSENAMANFERRGLPFRDVFDSSFDSVVYVDYLNPRTARKLLERRIVGKPYPFIYLCYCLSGGLPRDLIRNFRSLLELNQGSTAGNAAGKSLGALSGALITADLKAKVRATIASAKKINSDQATGGLIEKLFAIETAAPTPQTLMETARTLIQWQPATSMPPPSEQTEKQQEELDRISKVKRLSTELGSYLYLLSTVLGFFDDTLIENKLKSMATGGDLEKLANARQYMEISPSITVSVLDALRAKWGITTLNTPIVGNGAKAPAVTTPALTP